MDHLPKPSRPIHDAIEVPLRCDPSLHFVSQEHQISFRDYPHEQGRNADAILLGDIGPDPSAAEAFLQQWLFFRLISAIVNSCGQVFDSFDEFIYVNDQDIQCVTTKCLPDLIEKWSEAKNKLDFERQFEAIEEIDNILAEARYYVERLTFLAPSGEIDLPLDEEILLSIIIVGETLEYSKSNIFKDLVNTSTGPTSFWGNRHYIGWLLLEDGCCPHHIKMLEATLSAGAMYYVYRSGFSKDGKDHSRCNSQRCLAYQIDAATYKTAHRSAGCDCSFMEVPSEKVQNILLSGGIPVISLSSPLTFPNNIQLDVTQASSEMHYVAFSHVWSDGLGNPTSNSLPRCQIEYLRNSALAFFTKEDRTCDDQIMVWIDTICVPLQEPLRGRAIELIQTTFAQASEVIILDSKLESLSVKVPYTENLFRVVCCGWLRRLWTFLEGVVASKLYFLFKDEVTSIYMWMGDKMNDSSTRLWNLISVEAAQFWWLLRGLNRLDSSQRIARLWNALQWRSTSRKSDEYICVASLFGLEVSEIVKTPVELRMKKLLEMQKWFPPGIIFMDSARLDEEGFRWAPASFLAQQSNELGLINDGKAAVSSGKEGLFVQYSGLLLTVTKSPLCATSFVIDKRNKCVYFVMWQGEIPEEWQDVGIHALKRPALILSRDLSEVPETVAVLVNIRREEGGCLYVRHSTRVIVRRESTIPYDEHLQGFVSEADTDLDEYLYASSESLAVEQQWCVG